jgi:aryl-alcohol dehydrogenase-like predicted oxidoreductase
MHHTPIPNTELNPSALCLGGADMGGSIERQAAISLLDAFLDRGGTFIDTAKVYNDWIPGERSRSEKLIGAWLKERGARARVVLATKGAHFDLSTPNVPRLAPADIAADLEGSLANLQTDWIDLYWLHRDDPTRPVGEILAALHEQAQAGRIRYYGASNWTRARLEEAQTYAAARGLPGFAAVQNLWNLAHVERGAIADPTIVAMDPDLWNFHRRANLAAIPFSSQANGVFQKLAAGGSAVLSPHQQRVFLNPVTERRAARLADLRAQTGLTITQLVLGYLLSQPFPTIPVFSARSLAQLVDSLSAADVRLSPEQVEFLEASEDRPPSCGLP